jgi:hypothetical protein
MKAHLATVVVWASVASFSTACGSAGASPPLRAHDAGLSGDAGGVQDASSAHDDSAAQDAGSAQDASAAQSDSGTQIAPPPPIATACDADGGLGPVGVWQPLWLPQSFLPDQKLETSSVAVDPYDQAVYVAAGSYTNGGNSGTGVYRSSDCGATFQLRVRAWTRHKSPAATPGRSA